MNKKLIIISCSSRKKQIKKKVPAWELYDGVIFRVLKKNKIDFNKFDVIIISAKYGVLFPNDMIEYYEQKMTVQRAEELKPYIEEVFKNVQIKKYQKIFIFLGRNYLLSMPDIILNNPIVSIVSGGIGVKMKKLKSLITSKK